MKEMVVVRLFEDETYTVEDDYRGLSTQRLHGWKNEKRFEGYLCPKTQWKKYLLKLLSTKEIDREIKKLQERKAKMEKIKQKIIEEQSEVEE